MTYLIRVGAPQGVIYHFGVKGMRWGVRRAQRNAPNPNYSEAQRAHDRKKVGKRGVKYINRQMNKGKDHDKVYRKLRRAVIMRRVMLGYTVASHVLAVAGPRIMNGVAARAAANRGRAAVRGIEMWHPIHATRRGGAFNITSL